MGTKNNPGRYDCYVAAHPDEPMFVLLGRDPFAAVLVRAWAEWRRASGRDSGTFTKADEAEACAAAMVEWCLSLGRSPVIGNLVSPAEHGRRVSELIEANNAEIDRRRAAEREITALQAGNYALMRALAEANAGRANATGPDAGGMLAALIRLHREGVLSEGQVARATGIGRIAIRVLADQQSADEPAAPAPAAVAALPDPDLPTEGATER